MKPVFDLFEEKIFWYKKYLLCNEAFLQALNHAPEIAIDELELFHGNRESLLKILEKIDHKIQSTLNEEQRGEMEMDTAARTKIQFYLREKDSIIEKVLELDTQIITILEGLREGGSEKLKNLTKGKKALKSYKSGDKNDQKLDKRL